MWTEKFVYMHMAETMGVVSKIYFALYSLLQEYGICAGWKNNEVWIWYKDSHS